MSRKGPKSQQSSPALNLIGQRMRAERERLDLSIADIAVLFAVSEAAIEGWENSTRSSTAEMLTMFGRAGADVLYIVTGVRMDADHPALPPEGAILNALGQMPTDERRRLLLHLCTTELRRLISNR